MLGLMMMVRKGSERGHTNAGWLDSRHTFSFGDYYDPDAMGFRTIRVINDDRVAPGGGFPTHGHRDMEIISYVLEGELEHKDSIGTGSVITPGDVQRMSAGTGVRHSEYNASQSEPVHFLQIWIEPSVRGVKPSYEEKRFEPADKRGRLRLIASPDGRDGSTTIHQDAYLYAALVDGDEGFTHRPTAGRRTYVHVIRGDVTVNGNPLTHGDALKVLGEQSVRFESGRDAEVLLFDLP